MRENYGMGGVKASPPREVLCEGSAVGHPAGTQCRSGLFNQAPMRQPQVELRTYYFLGFGVSDFGVSGFEASGFEASGFEVSDFGVSGFEASDFGVSGFEGS